MIVTFTGLDSDHYHGLYGNGTLYDAGTDGMLFSLTGNVSDTSEIVGGKLLPKYGVTFAYSYYNPIAFNLNSLELIISEGDTVFIQLTDVDDNKTFPYTGLTATDSGVIVFGGIEVHEVTIQSHIGDDFTVDNIDYN